MPYTGDIDMKGRLGFVSNSSSTSFIIINNTNKQKTLVDFVKENPHLVEQYNSQYGGTFTLDELISDAENLDEIFSPNCERTLVFGDEDGTSIGCVYDYILRDGGRSASFKWHFDEYFR